VSQVLNGKRIPEGLGQQVRHPGRCFYVVELKTAYSNINPRGEAAQPGVPGVVPPDKYCGRRAKASEAHRAATVTSWTQRATMRTLQYSSRVRSCAWLLPCPKEHDDCRTCF
jgi:hypothetical protein